MEIDSNRFQLKLMPCARLLGGMLVFRFAVRTLRLKTLYQHRRFDVGNSFEINERNRENYK